MCWIRMKEKKKTLWNTFLFSVFNAKSDVAKHELDEAPLGRLKSKI